MAMNFYISDTHFGHRGVLNFDHRPFSDVEEMDSVLIKLWNSRVSPDDNVYILGDFAYRNEKPEEWYLSQLRGHKHLIIGNHDSKLLANEKAMGYFESVDKMMHVTDNGKQICLCHFPILQWNGYFKKSYHIYGHVHAKIDEDFEVLKKKERALNAGCMINGYSPVSFNELIINNKKYKEDMGN